MFNSSLSSAILFKWARLNKFVEIKIQIENSVFLSDHFNKLIDFVCRLWRSRFLRKRAAHRLSEKRCWLKSITCWSFTQPWRRWQRLMNFVIFFVIFFLLRCAQRKKLILWCCCSANIVVASCFPALHTEPGADGAESDSTGADERPREEEQQPGLLRPAARWGSSHTEATSRNRLLPQWPALPVQHPDPESSRTRSEPVPAAWTHL